MIFNQLRKILSNAIAKTDLPDIQNYLVEKTKELKFGDFSTNIAMLLAKQTSSNPSDVAQKIVAQIEDSQYILKTEIAKPGFINFFIKPYALKKLSEKILTLKEKYGQQPLKNQGFLCEVVSANPTGLLHVGHARNGVFCDTLCNLLELGGYNVYREYLINDAGNQIKTLAYAVYVNYMQLLNIEISLPSNSYHGFEIKECAKKFLAQHGDQYIKIHVANESFVHEKDEKVFANFAIKFFLKNIRDDLAAYQIKVDTWFSETTMHESKQITKLLDNIKKDLYEKDNATWFSASKYIKDQKDEVLIKSNKTTSYFCQDLAYHLNKLEKIKPDEKLINVFGADHHGHVVRMQAFLKSINVPLDRVIFIICQLVRLMKDNKEVKMSKRTGESLTMRSLLELVPYYQLRWFLVSQSINSHIDINLDLLINKTMDNPVYYVFYAYARIWQIIYKVSDFKPSVSDFDLLTTETERDLINTLLCYENTIINAAANFEPHKLCNYVYGLAKNFHYFYNQFNILNETNLELKIQRLNLIFLVQQTIYNCLAILKIKPEKQV